jgi:hypothetical protein
MSNTTPATVTPARTVKAEVKRFVAATAKESEARGIRLQSVDALLTVHSLKPAAASRVLFSLADDAPLTSRETSPVSHAATVGRIARQLNIDPQEGAPYDLLATLHRVATGTVKRAALDAAAATFAATLADAVPTLPQIEEWVEGLLSAKKSTGPRAAASEKEGDATDAAESDPQSLTPANVVAIPATIPELIAALGAAIGNVSDPADRDKFIAATRKMIAKVTLDRNAAVADKAATVKAAAEKRAA